MSTMRGPATDPAALARRYRALLVTYPRAYRRARGEEIVGTMLDAAPGDRTRPTAREAADLVAGGLRARLGRPRGRMVVALSLFTAVLAGLLGSVVGYRLGWQVAAPALPGNAEAHRIVADAAPGRLTDASTDRDDFVFGWPGERVSPWGELTSLAAPAGNEEYAPGQVSVDGHRGATDPAAYARTMRARLRADGWRPGPLTCYESDPCEGRAGRVGGSFTARRGDTIATFTVERGRREGGPADGGPVWIPAAHGPLLTLTADFYRSTPAFVAVAEIAAGLLAAALAWLAFAWFSRRTERHTRPARACAALAYGVLVAEALPFATLVGYLAVTTITTGRPDALYPAGAASTAPIDALTLYGAVPLLLAAPALLLLLALAVFAPTRTALPAGGDPSHG